MSEDRTSAQAKLKISEAEKQKLQEQLKSLQMELEVLRNAVDDFKAIEGDLWGGGWIYKLLLDFRRIFFLI